MEARASNEEAKNSLFMEVGQASNSKWTAIELAFNKNTTKPDFLSSWLVDSIRGCEFYPIRWWCTFSRLACYFWGQSRRYEAKINYIEPKPGVVSSIRKSSCHRSLSRAILSRSSLENYAHRPYDLINLCPSVDADHLPDPVRG